MEKHLFFLEFVWVNMEKKKKIVSFSCSGWVFRTIGSRKTNFLIFFSSVFLLSSRLMIRILFLKWISGISEVWTSAPVWPYIKKLLNIFILFYWTFRRLLGWKSICFYFFKKKLVLPFDVFVYQVIKVYNQRRRQGPTTHLSGVGPKFLVF
jgi:hypothetical protein